MNVFLKTLMGLRTSRPPVWLMRQAGRVLPRYMEMRERHSFKELMETPELAAEVTLMPVDDLGVDAAIIFSDILTIPAAMGMELEWTDRGPHFPTPLCSLDKPSSHLKIQPERLGHVYKAIDIVAGRSKVPLIGFCGAPLTTLCYMLQGISTRQNFPDAKRFIYENMEETRRLVDMLTEVSIHYATEQVEHGIDAFQLFESNAGLLPSDVYEEVFMPSVVRITRAVRSMGIPAIFFAKGLGCGLRMVTPDVCDFVGIDWQTNIWDARRTVHPAVGIQGNFDPHLLYAPHGRIAGEVEQYRKFFEQYPNWIANLGHGVLADTPIENVKYFINKIKEQ